MGTYTHLRGGNVEFFFSLNNKLSFRRKSLGEAVPLLVEDSKNSCCQMPQSLPARVSRAPPARVSHLPVHCQGVPSAPASVGEGMT